MDSNKHFSIISLNINHTTQMSGVIDILKTDSPTILFLQECPLDSTQLSLYVNRLGYKAYSSLIIDGPVPCPGVAIIYLDSICCNEILPLYPGRLLYVEINDWCFINVYAPSGNNKKIERDKLFGETLVRNLEFRNLQPILIGDFNCVLSPLDVEQNFNRKKCENLKRVITTFNYCDIWRHLNPQTLEFSYIPSNANDTPSRLDRAYLPDRAINICEDVHYTPSLSDHYALHIKFKGTLPPPTSRPKTYWKLNTSCLKSEDFMPNFLLQWEWCVERKGDYLAIELWWEDLAKPTLQNFLKRFGRLCAIAIKNQKHFLFHLLKQYMDTNNFERAKVVREKLSTLISENSYGYSINENAEEEKISIYHYNKCLKQGPNTSLSSLKIAGEEVTDPVQIEQEITQFFGALFNGHHRSDPEGGPPVDTGSPIQPDFTDLDPFLEGLGQLEEGEAACLEQPVTLDEYLAALEGCSKNKAPGPDGIPYGFYKKVANIIGPTMVSILNSQLTTGEFISSHRGGIVCLINKNNSKIPSVNDLRPISLSNSDAKIQSKCLSNRISGVLDSCLKSRQLCMRNNSNLLCGITDILSTLEYVNIKKLNAYLVSFDIFKAFDKTNISFVLKVMEKMKFKPKFRFWIESLHKNLFTSFFLNGQTSFLEILFSIRQGDALSMALFLLNIEPLLLKIHEAIKGIKVGSVVQKEEGYVDDISCISTDPKDLIILDNIFNKFETLSGTVLNRHNKCHVMGIGGWRGREEWPLPWLQSVNSIKMYGITFCPTLPLTTSKSWEECNNNFKKVLMSYNSRSLTTLQQRAFIIKTFATSKLWYLAQVLQVPKAMVKDFEKWIGTFLWAGRLERLPLTELSNPFHEGGLSLPNIPAKCNALFLRHLTRILCVDSPTRDHLLYWVGLRLRNMFPSLVPPLRAEVMTPYFIHCVRLLEDRSLPEKLNLENLTMQTTKQIYRAFNSTPPPPKIMEKRSLDWGRVWMRMYDPIISKESLDICFSLIHDIYPTKERVNRCRQDQTGFCPECPQTIQTSLHFFAECSSILSLWIYIKNLLVRNNICQNILVDCQTCLFLDLEVEGEKLKPYLFVISNYILYVHLNKHSKPTVSKLKSFLQHRKRTNLILNI